MSIPLGTEPKQRLISLDVLRGITIAFMIFVNNQIGGSAYWPLAHAPWNGWTPTDLVFPTFLFLVGIALVLSTESRIERGESKITILGHAIRRTALLLLLGLVVNGYPLFHLSTLRIYGVLQRIAICYLISLLLYLASKRVMFLSIVLVFALVSYFVIMRWVPVPGYGVPVADVPILDRDGNLVAYIDRILFPGRLYEITRDPEGLLSTLPAIGTTLIGVLTGILLRSSRTLQQKVMILAIAGACGLCIGELWNHWFLINKKLWTSSYVAFAGGSALLALSLCIYLIDVAKIKRGFYPFLVFGKNAIAAYIFAELLQSTVATIKWGNRLSLQRNLDLKMLEYIPSPQLVSALYSLMFLLICWIVMDLLYRRGIFLKL